MSFLSKAILDLTKVFMEELKETESSKEDWEVIGPRLLSQFRLFLKVLASTVNSAEPQEGTRNVTS